MCSLKQTEKKKGTCYKPSKVSVIVVEDLNKGVPKGKYHKELEQSELKVMLEFHRYMSSIQIRNAILRAFKHLALQSFQYLLRKDKTSLVLNTDQSQDGNKIINLIWAAKGCLYLLKCNESTEVCKLLLFCAIQAVI